MRSVCASAEISTVNQCCDCAENSSEESRLTLIVCSVVSPSESSNNSTGCSIGIGSRSILRLKGGGSVVFLSCSIASISASVCFSSVSAEAASIGVSPMFHCMGIDVYAFAVSSLHFGSTSQPK
jgi:hypothetical protein